MLALHPKFRVGLIHCKRSSLEACEKLSFQVANLSKTQWQFYLSWTPEFYWCTVAKRKSFVQVKCHWLARLQLVGMTPSYKVHLSVDLKRLSHFWSAWWYSGQLELKMISPCRSYIHCCCHLTSSQKNFDSYLKLWAMQSQIFHIVSLCRPSAVREHCLLWMPWRCFALACLLSHTHKVVLWRSLTCKWPACWVAVPWTRPL